MHQTGFEVAAFDNPFHRAAFVREFPEGLSVDQIIREANIDTQMYMHLQVTITLGSRSSVVPMSTWSKVRPKRGCHVQIAPVLHGAVIAPLLTTIVTAAAPTVASALFPSLTAGSFGLTLATAAVSVVGALAVRALIPPPQQQSSSSNSAQNDDPVYTLTGASNSAQPYSSYPSVLGRHIMFPLKTATGYTETIGGEVYLRERMTFGYGPVALSDIKIGTTPITEFEDIEIEFSNVDQSRTLAAMPSLNSSKINVVGWRNGTEKMSLYPSDIVEDNYSILLERNQHVVRQTREDTRAAHVDISFQGLVEFNDEGKKRNRTVAVRVQYRRVGASSWVTHTTKNCRENTTSYVRFTVSIDFPSADKYDIRVTRTTADTDDSQIRDKASLTAIRSIQSGSLPSHEHISEIAIRLKATNELNGQIQNLNAVVQQLVPVWDGTSWSSPQPVRHPAWIYARALMGPQLRDAVADTRLDLEALKAWADDEPHWTCDLVIDQPTRLADVLDMVCATGRAKRGLSDLKYSVIRDGGAGGIVQHFTPRTSWGFTGRKFLDREIHAFRVRVVSERKDWATDEIMVYADGYDASNATEIETLSLPGIVLDVDGDDQGNAYRLARYHLAVAKLRPEEFHFYSDLDHIPCQMGDKVRVVHDIPLFGVGSGRVKNIGASTLEIDEWHHTTVQRQPDVEFPEGDIAGNLSGRSSAVVFSADVEFPVDISDATLFEVGGGINGAWVGVRDNATIFRLRAGNGAPSGGSGLEPTSNMAILDVPMADMPVDGQKHRLQWEFEPDDGTIKFWVDGVLIGTGETAGGAAMLHGNWAGTNPGMWASGGNNVNMPLGEPSGAWPGEVSDLKMYQGTTMVDLGFSEEYRLRIRSIDGDEVVTTGVHLGRGKWNVPDGFSELPQVDDLVLVEKMSATPVDLLITGIQHLNELKARITAVPAAPEVLSADTGLIPDYDPQITNTNRVGPTPPSVVRVFSGQSAAIDNDIGIVVEVSRSSSQTMVGVGHRIRYKTPEGEWQGGQKVSSGRLLRIGGLTEGLSYLIEVQAVDALGRLGEWVPVSGVQYATITYDIPFDVKEFVAAEISGAVTLSWRTVDPSPVTYEIRHSVSSSDWSQSTPVVQDYGGTSVTIPSRNGTYLIKAISAAGNYSVNAKAIVISAASAATRNVIVAGDLHPDFTGSLTSNLTIEDDGIEIVTTKLWSDWGNWSNISNWAIQGGRTGQEIFTSDVIVDVGASMKSTVAVDLVIVSDDAGLRWSDWGNWSNIAQWSVDTDGKWKITPQMRTTVDDPNADPTWTDWLDVSVNEKVFRAAQFRVIVDVYDPSVVLRIEDFSYVIDVPDRDERGADISCPVGGIDIVFDSSYLTRPSVTVTGQDLPTGATGATTNVTVSGFRQEFFDTAGNSIAGSFDYIAKGYGDV